MAKNTSPAQTAGPKDKIENGGLALVQVGKKRVVGYIKDKTIILPSKIIALVGSKITATLKK